MLSVADARDRLLAKFSPLETIQVSLTQAMGKVLADGIVAQFDLPPFRNASMDGFAIRHTDLLGISKKTLVNSR